MTETGAQPSVDIRAQLHAWLTTLPVWQRDLAKRLTAAPTLDDEQYRDAFAVVTSTFGVIPQGSGPEPEAIVLDDLPQRTAGSSPRLLALRDVQGVGLVPEGQKLKFGADGLTVVYGPNAAGKSTYVRVLKRVCRAVDRESEVLGNVFDSSNEKNPQRRAVVEVLIDNAASEREVDLSVTVDLGLDPISVFDAQCAELYVTKQNVVAYVPSELLLLTRLAATQERMRADLDTERGRLSKQRPDLSEFAGTKLGKLLSGLDATSLSEVIDALATLDDDENMRLDELRTVTRTAESANARADAEAARQDAAMANAAADHIRGLAGLVTSTAQTELRNKAAALESAHAVVELMAAAFADLPADNVGGEPWRRLWSAARSFVEGNGAVFPPAANDACPLCFQTIAPDSAETMHSLEAHVRSSAQRDFEQASADLESALEALSDARVQQARSPFLAGLAEREPDLNTAVSVQLDSIDEAIRALRADPSAALPEPTLSAPERLNAWAAARSAHADALLAADSSERLPELQAELAELEARTRLNARMTEILDWLATLQAIAGLDRAKTALATNKITTKLRELSTIAVSVELDQELQGEMTRLHADHLPVDLHPETRAGSTRVELRLAGASDVRSVAAIASEGEQRALALAFFFAEVAVSHGDGGIVLDDPVSSLDDERRAYIAKRLVDEASRRQVIVFTHDLPFMLDLQNQAEDNGLEPQMQSVWRDADAAGYIEDQTPFNAMKFAKRLGALRVDAQEWDARRPDPYTLEAERSRVCGFYRNLRATWERGVEERVFAGVVQRLQRAVKTNSLKDVKFSPEIVDLVKEGMDRCALFVHDDPAASPVGLPGRAQIEADVANLEQFDALTRARR